MTVDAGELTEIEQDALAEIANMGVSRAANSLRQMVGEAGPAVCPLRQDRNTRGGVETGRARIMRRSSSPCSSLSKDHLPARRS